MQPEDDDGAQNMVDVEQFVTRLVENKLAIFRSELDLELLPLKLAVEQIVEMRAAHAALGQSQARIEGQVGAFIEEQRRNHIENRTIAEGTRQETGDLVRLFHAHIGEHSGRDKHKDETEKQGDRVTEKRRAWFKVLLGIGTSGGVVKWLHDHWHRFHLK